MISRHDPVFDQLAGILVALAVRDPDALDEVRALIDDIEDTRPRLILIPGCRSLHHLVRPDLEPVGVVSDECRRTPTGPMREV